MKEISNMQFCSTYKTNNYDFDSKYINYSFAILSIKSCNFPEIVVFAKTKSRIK